MTEQEQQEQQGSSEPLESPGEGHPTGETLGEGGKTAGELNLEKDDVGFGQKGEEDTAS